MSDSDELNILDIEQVFRMHHKMLCNVSYALVKDKSIAEDIVQDVFLNLWRKRKDIIIDSNLKGYLYRAVSNASLNHIKSYYKKNVKLKEEFKDSDFEPDFLNEKLDDQRLERIVNDAIDKLPPKCKAIFVLSRFENLKQKQIADTLKLSLKTVENQIGIALSKLREELKSQLKKDFILLLCCLNYFFN